MGLASLRISCGGSFAVPPSEHLLPLPNAEAGCDVATLRGDFQAAIASSWEAI